ncbi:23S rRNA (uracil(1939)-C(5))-methyltransferase [hydrothermal vent metagenome]|uniref:23S rRNA (Uracil(1939)-C(5))-methyltransferase n=1 Tax=hydrothermal vent metagenome TaxID=652676 RepID=A0A3B1A1S8_9ZZZZ
MSRRRKRKNSAPVQAKIKSLNTECQGVTRINDKVTFVTQSLPGEEVILEYTKKHSRYDVAKTIEVVSSSKDRIEPKCKHFEMCGGCQLQHMPSEYQIQQKQDILVEQFKNIAKLELNTVLPAITGDSWGYRRKARLGVRYVRKKERVLVGFRERNGRFLADLTQCEVLHKSVGQNLLALSDLVQSLVAYDKIAQIEVAVGDSNSALVFRNLVKLSSDDSDKLENFAKQFNFDIYCQPGGPESVYPVYPKSPTLDYSLAEYDLSYDFEPGMFTQVNYDINHKMIARALDLLKLSDADTVLDLFCGLGNFSLPISKFAKNVIGVEGELKLVKQATHNAQKNNIKNTEFFTANLMDDFTQLPWFRNKKYTKILIDPPRTGAELIVKDIAKLQAEKIVYVSCNPATLARDAGILVHECGYKLDSAGVMDMFPHTAHVESIALFTK